MGLCLGKQKTEGGSGGKRGHSNMCHRTHTEEIKAATKKARRQQAKQLEKIILAQGVEAHPH